MTEPKPTRIFISYRRTDTNLVAENIYLHLREAFGRGTVFKDNDTIKPGDYWEKTLLTHLEQATVILVLIDQNFQLKAPNGSEVDWIHRELTYSLQSETKRVIHILIDRTEMPGPEAFPRIDRIQKLLSGRQAYRTIRSDSMRTDMRSLIEYLSQAADIPRLAIEAKTIQAVNPKRIIKANRLNWWQRLLFPFLRETKKHQLALETLDLFAHNEITYMCTELQDYLNLQVKDSHGKIQDFVTSFLTLLDDRKNDQRFYLLLGETGSGKSTALAKLFTRYATKKRHFDIVFFKFQQDLQSIYQLTDQKNIILLLDGIDDTGDALRDPDGFFTEVEEHTKGFARVVISCRTQFFVNQAAERSHTYTHPANPYQKYYLQFLDKDTVRSQISRVFPPLSENDNYRLAYAIVNQSGDHFTRPLLLPYLKDMVAQADRFLFLDPDSLDKRVGVTAFEIYEIIIREWIFRERKRVERVGDTSRSHPHDYGRELWRTSKAIARYVYLQEGKAGAPYIFYVDLRRLPQQLELNLDEVHLRTDSLLHRNEAGYYRFAHRTFKEFFYAVLLYEGRIAERDFPFDQYEEAARFYREMCEIRYFRAQPHTRRRRYRPGEAANTPLVQNLGIALGTFAFLENIRSGVTIFQLFRRFTSAISQQEHYDAFVDAAEYLVKQEKVSIAENRMIEICETYELHTAELLTYFFFSHDPVDGAFQFIHLSFAEFFCLDEMLRETDAVEMVRHFPFDQLRFRQLFISEIKWLRLQSSGHSFSLRMDGAPFTNEHFQAWQQKKEAQGAVATYFDYYSDQVQADYADYAGRLGKNTWISVRTQEAGLLTEIPFAERVRHLDLAHNGFQGPIDLRSFQQLETLAISGNPGLELTASFFPDSLKQLIYSSHYGVIKGIEEMKTSFPKLTISPNGNKAYTLLTTPFTAPEMVHVAGGKFWRGSHDDPDSDEFPRHLVALSDFKMGRYPVTRQEFARFVRETGYTTTAECEGWAIAAVWIAHNNKSTLSHFPKAGSHWMQDAYGHPMSGDQARHPVIQVSWHDAQAYCRWLSAKTGKNYRLPTEAEWEYAAIGGQYSGCRDDQGQVLSCYTYAGSDDLDKVGWYFHKFEGRANSLYRPQQVGGLQPNQLGIFDLSGNVWEWCRDWYAKDYYRRFENQVAANPQGAESGDGRVLRGGSWDYFEDYCQVSIRNRINPNVRDYRNGFRLAQDSL
ncbi:SUMF1/EgtB/PvdO family nonheme iron enzyme [Flavilitoribacter nigricans]|nr:SUMF1/EgtB/PvdO family nonheme iron enzyme [Flavilitoribacter nigricans]